MDTPSSSHAPATNAPQKVYYVHVTPEAMLASMATPGQWHPWPCAGDDRPLLMVTPCHSFLLLATLLTPLYCYNWHHPSLYWVILWPLCHMSGCHKWRSRLHMEVYLISVLWVDVMYIFMTIDIWQERWSLTCEGTSWHRPATNILIDVRTTICGCTQIAATWCGGTRL